MLYKVQLKEHLHVTVKKKKKKISQPGRKHGTVVVILFLSTAIVKLHILYQKADIPFSSVKLSVTWHVDLPVLSSGLTVYNRHASFHWSSQAIMCLADAELVQTIKHKRAMCRDFEWIDFTIWARQSFSLSFNFTILPRIIFRKFSLVWNGSMVRWVRCGEKIFKKRNYWSFAQSSEALWPLCGGPGVLLYKLRRAVFFIEPWSDFWAPLLRGELLLESSLVYYPLEL